MYSCRINLGDLGRDLSVVCNLDLAEPCPPCLILPTLTRGREVVLLDFHRFPGLDHGPPHEKAATVVLETLEGVMIQPKHRNLPFRKLMANQTGRIGVLWNAKEVCARAGCWACYVNALFVKHSVST